MIVHGKVKKWLADKGYGFVRQDAPGPDVFVFWRVCRESLLGDCLPVDARVRVECEREPDGRLRATFVEILEV